MFDITCVVFYIDLYENQQTRFKDLTNEKKAAFHLDFGCNMNYVYRRSIVNKNMTKTPKLMKSKNTTEKNMAKYTANTQNQNKIITCQFQTAYGFRYIGLNVNLKFILFFESLRHNKVGKKMI